MLLAKVAAPEPTQWKNWPAIYEQALNNNLTIFIIQPGYFWSDGLMAMLNEHSRSACWLRLEPEDGDPGGLLLSLIAAAQRISPVAGMQTLAAMRQTPGPAAGWEPLFGHLGQELLESLPGNSVVVIENLQHIASVGETIRLLLSSFLPWVSRRFPSLLTTDKPISLGSLPGAFVEHHTEDLRLDFHFASALFKEKCATLDDETILAALQTLDGRAAGLAALCSTGDFLDAQFVKSTILESKNSKQLFTHLSEAILKTALPVTSQALAVTNRITYTHPDLVSAALGTSVEMVEPWLQPLSEGWQRVYQVWNLSLKNLVQVPVDMHQRAVLHAADYLYSRGAATWAICTYFDCGALGSAARAAAGVVDHFLDLGLWQTLSKWLKRLPREVLEEWPSLVYALGEIEALSGNLHSARAAFISAGQLFANRQDLDGFCQSKLAESALAVQQEDREQAWSSALAASALAARFGLTRQGNWANWQLGRLAAAADQLDDALAFFSQVTKDVRDPIFFQLFNQAEGLAQILQAAKLERETHRQAFLDLQKSELETANRLNLLFNASLPQAKGDLTFQAWSQLHPVLKFSAPPSEGARSENERFRLWGKFVRALGLRKSLRKISKKKTLATASHLQLELPLFQSVVFLPEKSSSQTDTTSQKMTESLNEQEENAVQEPTTASPAQQAKEPPPATQIEGVQARDQLPNLAIHCLGPFRAYLDDQLLENWPLRKSLAIFKYLLLHRQNFVSKEILMDTFWPEADPEAARRNLHQAIYALRQTLHHAESNFQFIIFTDDRYRLNPVVEIWSDDEEFLKHYETGRRIEKEGKQAEAVQDYETAVDLYRGDFMAEDLYEDWLTNRRDYLRQLYLVTVYRLVDFYESRKDYSIAAGFCQRIVYMDDCQEEAHLNLMKFYLAQGKRNQAVQQYHLCRQALRTKMNLPPTPEMQELYRQIMKK